jgi:hypothetical protein
MAEQRFQGRTNLNFASADSGATGALMDLSRRFEGIRDQNINKFKELRVEEEFNKGQQAGIELEKGKQPSFMDEDRFIGGVTAKAYNKGLRASYMAGLSNDIRADLDRIETDHGSDSATYTAMVAANRAALLENVDPSVAPAVIEQYDRTATMGAGRVYNREAVTRRNAAVAEMEATVTNLSNSAERFYRNGEPEAGTDAINELRTQVDLQIDAGTLTTSEGTEVLRLADNGAMEARNNRAFTDSLDAAMSLPLSEQDAGIRAVFKDLDDLATGKVPKSYTPDEYDAYINGQQQDLNRQLGRNFAKARQSAAQVKKATDYKAIENRISGDNRQVVSPSAVDDYFQENIVPNISGLPAEEQSAAIASFIDSTKVIPTSLKIKNSSMIQSGDPELMAEVIALVDRLDEIPGATGDLISRDQQAFAELAVNLSQNMEPPEAVRVARQATDPKDSVRIASVQAELDENKTRADDYREDAVDIYDGFLGLGGPDVDLINQGIMGKEYGEAYESYRLSGMDESQAKKAASGTIKRNWGEWEGRVIKYPPSTYYQIQGDDSYVMEQLTAEVNESFISQEQITPDRIILVPNDDTARTASTGAPAYAVTIIADDGTLQAMPQMWMPDVQGEIDRRTEETISAGLERRLAAQSSTPAPAKAPAKAPTKAKAVAKVKAVVKEAAKVKAAVEKPAKTAALQAGPENKRRLKKLEDEMIALRDQALESGATVAEVNSLLKGHPHLQIEGSA